MRSQFINFTLSLILSPLLLGIINKVKALFAGRKGPPILQLYYDIIKLFKKGAVYSHSVSWIFTTAPIVSLSALIVALMCVPFPTSGALISFRGDVIFFVYLLALSRFATVLAALDTASSFEGMGASREVMYSAIAEPAFLLALAVLLCKTANYSLTEIPPSLCYGKWKKEAPSYVLISASLFIILLSENCRVPFDDPNTHLELTMIHEVMILDYSGPDLGFMLYASSLKLWIFSSILVLFVLPIPDAINSALKILLYFIEVSIVALLIGIIESVMARLNFLKVPLLLLLATVLSLIGLILVFRY